MAETAGFKRALRKVYLAAKREALPATLAAAKDMADTMRRVAPVSSGNLVQSIKVVVDVSDSKVLIKAGGKLTTKEVRKGSGVPYDYAFAQEFGTKDMPASPFFWPVYRLKKKNARARMTRALKRAVALEAKKQGLGDG
jgi:HK97 gp10 family phage protein